MLSLAVNDVELVYEVAGNPEGPAVLLIAGLGVQMIGWPEHFVDPLVAAGHYVIRFDNRDIGLSTTFEHGQHDPQAVLDALATEQDPGLAYMLRDMASDAIGLLGALDISAAHLVGVSMGGMIAQIAAIEFPERVLTLTSIMSTTGAGDVGRPSDDAMATILSSAPATDRESMVAHNLSSARVWSSPGKFNADLVRQTISDSWDRAGGSQALNSGRQFSAIVAAPPRDEALRAVTVPALVIHGTDDVLIATSGGERTAACLPNAQLRIIAGMGHDLQPIYTPEITKAIIDLVAGTPTA